MSRLREGRANTARGAAHFLRMRRWWRVRYGGARGQLTVRADSGFYAHTVVAAWPGNGCPLLYHHPPARQPAGPDRGDTRGADWTPIPYWMDGAADVAETTYTTVPDQAETPRRCGSLSGG